MHATLTLVDRSGADETAGRTISFDVAVSIIGLMQSGEGCKTL